MRIPGLILAALVTVSSPLLAQPTISNTSLPFGGVGQDYLAPIKATCTAGCLITVSPSPPAPGLFFNGDLNRIEGQPTTAGAFPVTIKVTDTQTQTTASKTLTIDVMQITTPTQLPGGSTCSSYSQSFTVSDAPPPPYNWSFDDSAPPPGLNINATTGVLSGTPTSSGPFSFTVEAFSASANVFATQTFSLTVSSLCFLAATLPNGDLNSFYRESLVVTGGTAPFTWSIKAGGLPTGVSIDPKSGLLSGTPTVAGPFNFTVQVVDTTGASAAQSFSITINSALAFTTTSPLAPGTAGTNYSVTFAATGGSGPYT
ncbi:MAG TPA: Ig domain-containing protein, partial [Bryobacteraceae bacterium]|nr:Ig domain-containing protein [Bryobacteraceae bacterium]